MAEETMKDFTINWAIIGLLTLCLISFTISFMYYNNPIGLDDGTGDVLGTSNTNMTSRLYEIEGTSNELLNITSSTNIEIGQSGSGDQVATAYKTYEAPKSTFSSMLTLISWVFTGEVGKTLITVGVGLMGFLGVYFIIKQLRTGI